MSAALPESGRIWYGTFFDHLRCDEPTKKGEQCRLIPAYIDRASGKLLCFVHAEIVFQERKANLAPTHPHPLDGTHEGLRRDCPVCDAEDAETHPPFTEDER